MGILLGIVFGAVQIYLLILGVRSISGDKLKIWPFVVQFFCPMTGLLLCAFLAREQLLLCACFIVGVLILGALAEFIRNRRKNTGDSEKRDK